MWAGNNVTRPFRLAGAAALAPFMDTVIDRLQVSLLGLLASNAPITVVCCCRCCCCAGRLHRCWPALNTSSPARLPPPPSRSTLQAKLRLRSKTAAFAILVALVAGVCFAILGALFFSRWIQG